MIRTGEKFRISTNKSLVNYNKMTNLVNFLAFGVRTGEFFRFLLKKTMHVL